MEVYRHLRVSVFRLSNTDSRMAEYQKIQPAQTIELRSYTSSNRVVTYDIACKISLNAKLPSPIQCHISAIADWRAGVCHHIYIYIANSYI